MKLKKNQYKFDYRSSYFCVWHIRDKHMLSTIIMKYSNGTSQEMPSLSVKSNPSSRSYIYILFILIFSYSNLKQIIREAKRVPRPCKKIQHRWAAMINMGPNYSVSLFFILSSLWLLLANHVDKLTKCYTIYFWPLFFIFWKTFRHYSKSDNKCFFFANNVKALLPFSSCRQKYKRYEQKMQEIKLNTNSI